MIRLNKKKMYRTCPSLVRNFRQLTYTGFTRIYVRSIYSRVAALLPLYALKVKLRRAVDIDGVCGIRLLMTSYVADRRQGNGECWKLILLLGKGLA